MAPPAFIHNPITEMEDNFLWDGHIYLFTYVGHHDKRAMLECMRGATTTPLGPWAGCWEEVSHKHTHWVQCFNGRLGLRGCRKFDLYPDTNDGTGLPGTAIHPNVKKLNWVQCEQVMLGYLAGWKHDISVGKKVYKEPIWYEAFLPPLFEFRRAKMEAMLAAPTLKEACLAIEVMPTSVMACKALRDDEASVPKRVKHLFSRDSFKPLACGNNWHTLHLWGGTGLGKTKLAISLFHNPLMVKPFSNVGGLEYIRKNYNERLHDGIILDEANLSFMSREEVIGLFDRDDDFVVNVRFTSFVLPPCRKVLVSNEHPIKSYPVDPSGAVQRRVTVLEVKERTWRPVMPLRPIGQNISPQLRAPVQGQPTTPLTQ